MFGSRARRNVPLDVVAAEFTTGVVLHTVPQVQLDLLRIGAQIPVFGEHGLRLLVCIVSGQPVGYAV